MTMFRLLLFCLLVVSQSLPAQIATPPTDTTEANLLTELVVTARRAETDRFRTAEAIEALPAVTMRRRSLRTAPEALAATPGVFVQKTNHGGGSPFVRGLTGNQILLLVDGIRISNATSRYGPNQYFNTVDIFGLERIEVLRGSGSVPYGSDALGGVVQAISRSAVLKDRPAWDGNLLLRGATQGMEQTLHAETHYGSPRLALTGGLSLRRFGDLVGGDTTGRQTPSGYREIDFDGKGKFALSPRLHLTLAHQNVRQRQVPVFHKIQLENFALNEFAPQGRRLSYALLEQQIERGIWQSWRFTAALHQTEEGRRSRKNGSTLLRLENDRVRSLGLIAQVSHRFNGIWSANSGVEFYDDLVKSSRADREESTGATTQKRGLYPDGAVLRSFAAFTLHTWELPRWQLSAGLRWNGFAITVADDAIGTTRLRPSALVGNAAVLRRLGPRLNVFAAANTGFRAPNVDDLGTLGIVDFRFETPNYALRPEHSLHYQLGIKLQSARLRGEIFAYRNDLRDLIARVRQDTLTRQGYPLYYKDNVERAYIQGLETDWTFMLTPKWSARGSVTYTYGQNVSTAEPVRRIPPLFGRLALDYVSGSWSAGAEWLAATNQDRLAKGDTEDNRIPAGGTPGWQVLNLHGAYAWPCLSLSLSALNLFNRDYRLHGSGVNGYGRSAWLTVGLRI